MLVIVTNLKASVYVLSGQLVFDLLSYTSRLQAFSDEHAIRVHNDSHTFNADVLRWHRALVTLMVSAAKSC